MDVCKRLFHDEIGLVHASDEAVAIRRGYMIGGFDHEPHRYDVDRCLSGHSFGYRFWQWVGWGDWLQAVASVRAMCLFL
jgi:hypothetical protein